MDTRKRRELIATVDSADPRSDFLVTLTDSRRLEALGCTVDIAVRYVPDRCVVETSAWNAYLDTVAEQPVRCLEDIAALLLGDIADVIIPRWCAVTVSVDENGCHRVTVSDRQPNWEDKEGLIMLERIVGGAS